MYDMDSKYVPIIQTRILPLYPEYGAIMLNSNVATELLGYGVMFNSFIQQSVLRQVQSLFQSELST